jgi:hypothetical protein
VRRLLTPTGHQWNVERCELPPGVSIVPKNQSELATSVLRFTAGKVMLELVGYPDDWESLNDGDLAKLLRRATSPAFSLFQRPTHEPATGARRTSGSSDENGSRC